MFLYLGTHDECDTWVNNNKGLEPDMNQGQVMHSQSLFSEASVSTLDAEEPIYELEQDRPLHEILDQKTLREIFQGICQKE
ncbi:MAG: hypothetical protein R6U22_04015 [Desulfohalobiaceae bacterium]